MADPRFFDRQGPFTLGDIVSVAGASLPSEIDPDRSFDDVAPLIGANAKKVSFLDNPKYIGAFKETRAGACFVSPQNASHAPDGTVVLVTESPYRAFALAARMFYPLSATLETEADGRAIHSTARLGKGCVVGHGVVIEAHVEIGDGTRIGPNTFVKRGVVIGRDCILHDSVTVSHAIVGNRVEIHAGAKIGQDGFGFAPDPPGYITVPQLGRVLIGNDVSIGANTTIDRGAGPDTKIGDNCRIDNLVQIAHNVELGRGCVLAAQVGISGSTKIGDYVVMGGQVGLAGHLTVASGVVLAGKSGVTHDLKEPGTYGGFPAVPVREWRKQVALLRRLAKKRDGNDG
ncbi:MAG: UDP-3-O-(3-hydroxymyristoyl)glucosamine N-acyltransferase [Alphaproteobacteria bacterium]